jgi:hypothetical protein
MLRSLPSVSRLIPTLLLTLITTVIVYRSLSLEHRINVLSEDIDKLRKPELPKQLTPEELVWENRRTECGEVVRNIDYQHVQSLKNKAYYLERQS